MIVCRRKSEDEEFGEQRMKTIPATATNQQESKRQHPTKKQLRNAPIFESNDDNVELLRPENLEQFGKYGSHCSISSLRIQFY